MFGAAAVEVGADGDDDAEVAVGGSGGQQPRALRRLVTGTVLAAVSTAAMVAVTLPMNAQGDERGGKGGGVPAVAAPGSARTGQAPLSDEEIDRARSLIAPFAR